MGAIAVVAAMGAFMAPAAEGAVSGPGKVNFVRNATSSFDPYLTGSSSAQRQWIANTYWRIRGYDPFFANVGAVNWTGPSHYYEDLYAIYRDFPEHQALMNQHPDWVLRDGAGRPLFIPADCNGQTCTQYAADIGNPGYRAWWISQARSTLAKGYEGIFIDDVNMDMKVSDGAAQDVAPIDPRSGAPMSRTSWRRYMAEFTEQIAAGLDQYEIVHNSHWWVEHDDPYVQRQVDSADILELERGYNDGGLVGGGGKWGFETFMNHIDWVHSRGKSVILEPYDLNPAKQEYEIASYFLTRAGSDAIASGFAADPGNWSTAWETDLGAPLGARYEWKGIWRRDYTNGIVLVNQPDQPTQKLSLEPYRRLGSGAEVTDVSLPAARGAVLLGSPKRDDTKTTLSASSRPSYVRLSGRVKSAWGENEVQIRVERRNGKRWAQVKSVVTKLTRKGRFKAKVRGLADGPYRAEATYTGSWDTKPSSARRRFKLR
jgi:Hypothetical glycosyl hydrolase family 15